ncbi:MAG: dihydroxyacetone kinase subunit DhaL [Candidatus Humimicrobiaceae bacterium]
MDKLDIGDIKTIFERIRDIMVENEDYLFELDSKMGDGDLGITMKNGFVKVDEELKSLEETDIGKIFMKAGMVLASAVPSTMGTLMATGLIRAGKEFRGKSQIELSDLAEGFLAFINGIMERGKSKPGEKTIIDSVLPAAESLKNAVNKKGSLSEAFKIAYSEAKKGLESTKNMTSIHGKAFYHTERSKGTVDPGAAAGVLFIRGFSEYLSM